MPTGSKPFAHRIAIPVSNAHDEASPFALEEEAKPKTPTVFAFGQDRFFAFCGACDFLGGFARAVVFSFFGDSTMHCPVVSTMWRYLVESDSDPTARKIVPIPKVKGITINRSDGNRVLFVMEAPYDAKAGYPRPRRTMIGYVCDDDTTKMHPTTSYKNVFSNEWEKMFNEKVPVAMKYIGMYAMAESVNMKTGIKDAMDRCLNEEDPSASDAMMDFAMYSMLYQTSVAEHFPSRMKNQMLWNGAEISCDFIELPASFEMPMNHWESNKWNKGWSLVPIRVKQCHEHRGFGSETSYSRA